PSNRRQERFAQKSRGPAAIFSWPPGNRATFARAARHVDERGETRASGHGEGRERRMDIASIVWDFDEALRDGQTMVPADYLGRLDEGLPRLELLVELICCELSHRQGAPGI